MQTSALSTRNARIALAVALLVAAFGAATRQDASAETKVADFSKAAGVIVAADEQLVLAVTNPGTAAVKAVLTVSGADGQEIRRHDIALAPGATVMPDVLSGEELAGEDSTEWPIYGQPVNVSLTSAGGELKPILSVTTLDVDGGGARAWPIYGRKDLVRL